jgi:hypothetical protein
MVQRLGMVALAVMVSFLCRVGNFLYVKAHVLAFLVASVP